MSFFQIDQHLRRFKAAAQGTQGVDLVRALEAAMKFMPTLKRKYPKGGGTFDLMQRRCKEFIQDINRLRQGYPYVEGQKAPKPLLDKVREAKGVMLHMVEDVQNEMDTMVSENVLDDSTYQRIRMVLEECYMAV